MEASQIEMARSAAAAGGHANASFRTGDATDLPFEDDSFDIAHCHAVLMHVPDTQAALAEVKRVLKPGGMLSTREMIGNATFFEPEVEDLSGAMETFLKLLRANGGHPRMGCELKRDFCSRPVSPTSGAGASVRVLSLRRPRTYFSFHGLCKQRVLCTENMTLIEKHGLAAVRAAR